MKNLFVSLAFLFASSMTFAAQAPISTERSYHSGGTDAAGCHTNHKTGAYHCH